MDRIKDKASAFPDRAPWAEHTKVRIVHAQQLWLSLLSLAPILPFVRIGDESHTGIGGLLRGIPLIATAPFAALLLTFPWRGTSDARATVGASIRAWFATLGALLAVFGPVAMFLFNRPKPQLGWWLHGAGWVVFALAQLGVSILTAWRAEQGTSATSAAAPLEAIAMMALAGAPFVSIVKNGWTSFGLFWVFVGLAAGLPLIVGGVVIRRVAVVGTTLGASRAIWWGAVLMTLLLPIAELIERL